MQSVQRWRLLLTILYGVILGEFVAVLWQTVHLQIIFWIVVAEEVLSSYTLRVSFFIFDDIFYHAPRICI